MKYKILFLGDLRKYTRSNMRKNELINLGLNLDCLSYAPLKLIEGVDKYSIIYRIFNKLKIPLDLTKINQKIQSKVSITNYDIIWFDKATNIKLKTFNYIKYKNSKTKIIFFSEDDMCGSHNTNIYFERLKFKFDHIFTTKKHNIKEMKKTNINKIHLINETYSKIFLNQNSFEIAFKYDVSFIGSFEKNRFMSMLYLAKNGIKVNIFGNGWKKIMNIHQNLIIHNKPLLGEDYIKGIKASKINLGFLRKLNRDTTTSRSIEIPSIGGFFLGERTKDHLSIYKEGYEAEFFSDDQELKLKIDYYLKNNNERVFICKNGNKKSNESKFSMEYVLKNVISQIMTNA